MHINPQEDVKQSIMALWRALPILIIVTVLVFGIAYIMAKKTSPSYEVHFSYIVAQQQRDTAPDFRYDGFYSLSGTELFSETLASLISSPEQVVHAYNIANLPLTTQDPISLIKHVKAEKAASQLVQVTVSDASQQDAEMLASAVQKSTESAVQEYNQKNKDTAQFSITQTTPWTGVVQLAALPVALVAGMVALCAAILIVLFQEALKRGEQ